ncbi:hypothetical protein [Algicola sagamiensis]|uniref:hypothetical protein n=1 Tax=Algicola sagamiensis TaxID=163869 RepID=UPI0003A4CBE6|nr:hypothetical protein [Algicola sagamiensis]
MKPNTMILCSLLSVSYVQAQTIDTIFVSGQKTMGTAKFEKDEHGNFIQVIPACDQLVFASSVSSPVVATDITVDVHLLGQF